MCDSHPVRVHGMIGGVEGPAGSWVSLQVDGSGGRAIEPGFSGTALSGDDTQGVVVGMVIARDADYETRKAYYLPATELMAGWTRLGAIRPYRVRNESGRARALVTARTGC